MDPTEVTEISSTPTPYAPMFCLLQRTTPCTVLFSCVQVLIVQETEFVFIYSS